MFSISFMFFFSKINNWFFLFVLTFLSIIFDLTLRFLFNGFTAIGNTLWSNNIHFFFIKFFLIFLLIFGFQNVSLLFLLNMTINFLLICSLLLNLFWSFLTTFSILIFITFTNLTFLCTFLITDLNIRIV